MGDVAGISAAERAAVKATWDVVRKDIGGNGVELFIRFFTEHPGMQAVFKNVKDIPMSELRTSKKLLAHANNVLCALTMLIDNLDDGECLIELLKKLGRNHTKRNLTADHFNKLKGTLVGMLKEKLGGGLMNDKAVAAWDKTYGVIVTYLMAGIEEGKTMGE